MKKTKNLVTLVLFLALMFLCIVSANNKVLADDEGTKAFNLGFTIYPENLKVPAGQTLTIQLLMKDFDTSTLGSYDGVNSMQGFLEYDEDVFEKIQISVSELGIQTGFVPSEIRPDITLPIKGEGGFSYTYNDGVHTEEPEKKGAFISSSGSNRYVTSGKFITITLVAKADATIGNTEVKIKDLKAANPTDNGKIFLPKDSTDPDTGIKVENGTITIPVETPDAPIKDGKIRILPKTSYKALTGILKAKGFTVESYDVPNGTATRKITDVEGSTDFVITGTKANIKEGTSNNIEVIVIGDINQDGAADISDLSMLQEMVIAPDSSLEEYSDAQMYALDVLWDCYRDVSDQEWIQNLAVGIFYPDPTLFYDNDNPDGTNDVNKYRFDRPRKLPGM